LPAGAPNTAAGATPWLTFAVCSVATYITTLDLSIVNVAFAEIASSFPSVSRAGVSWVVTAYSILFGSLLVVAGRLADRAGRRRVFLAGSAVFLVGSAMCAVAPGLGWLIAGRVVQGAGGAALMPASLGLLLAAFPATRRTQVVALNGGIGALGVASGPTLGAFLVSAGGWRAAFWINVPICVAAFLVGRRVLHESPRQGGVRPDLGGAVLVTAGVAALVLGISEGENWGWSDAKALAAYVTAAALLAAFVHRSLRHPEPVLPTALFREPTFASANAASFAFGAAFAAMALNNVLFLRTVWDYSVLRAGWFSVLAPVTVAVVSMFAGRLVPRLGFRTVLVVGTLLFAATEVACTRLLGEDPTPWTRWLPLGVALGVGIGLTFPVLAAAAVSHLPAQSFAVGGAANNTFRQVGAAVGVALVVAVQSASPGIAGFHRGWLLSAAGAVVAAVLSLRQPGRPAPIPAAATARLNAVPAGPPVAAGGEPRPAPAAS
jgi:EmrB/QacA subfamily drug resistance transporter